MQKLDRKAIDRQLAKEALPAAVRRMLELRLGGAQAAVKKVDALLAEPARMIVCEMPSAIMAPPPAVGLARVSSRRT